MGRNPNDRTSRLMPVNVQFEKVADGRVYAYGWGGGLDDAVTSELFGTREEAFRDLCRRLRDFGRMPSMEGVTEGRFTVIAAEECR